MCKETVENVRQSQSNMKKILMKMMIKKKSLMKMRLTKKRMTKHSMTKKSMMEQSTYDLFVSRFMNFSYRFRFLDDDGER
nr:hypothetical protein CFP56_19105 [Quercus suber]